MMKIPTIQAFLKEQTTRIRTLTTLSLDEVLPNLELQINVDPEQYKPVSGKTKSGHPWRGFQGDGYVFKNFRIPWSANSTPEFTDSPLRWPFKNHVKAIGSTGWDWRNQQSLYVGFDIDSIQGHSQGLDDRGLEEVKAKLSDLDWVELRRSKSGRGFHAYVVFDTPVQRVTNHTEHAKLAKYLLGLLSTRLSFDFSSRVDVCGSNLWLWHTDADVTKSSFALIKQGRPFQSASLPDVWRDYEVGKKRSSKGVDMDELLRKVKSAPLDDQHRRLLDWLFANNYLWWWDAEYNMLVTHTKTLEIAHRELDLRGIFNTKSTGRDLPNDQNSFAFPIKNGSWTVRRHHKGTEEHPSWHHDRSGWTTCYYNKYPSLDTACRSAGGLPSGSGSYLIPDSGRIPDIFSTLGSEVNVPDILSGRESWIKRSKENPNEVYIDVKAFHSQEPRPEGWVPHRGPVFRKVVHIRLEEEEAEIPDEKIRHCIADRNEDAGFYYFSNNTWVKEPKDNIRLALTAEGVPRGACDILLGNSVSNPWRLTRIPFEREYPGNRVWNLDAPQIAFDLRPGEFPTWQKILDHVGSNLEPNEWCIENEIFTGADYLLYWVASMFQYPIEPLPYLFLYGPQNSGKSVFHEALKLLFKNGHGCVRADNAIQSKQNFNGELYGAVLAVIEETNLKQSKTAYNKIKDWVTGRTISIHIKGITPFDGDNYCHWVHCANDSGACPVFSGDSRITVVYVPKPAEEIPKEELFKDLVKEAPFFLNYILKLDIPPTEGRLRVPTLESEIKEQIIDVNENPVVLFLRENTIKANGYYIPYEEFYDRFTIWLDPAVHGHWDKNKIARSWPDSYPKGKMTYYQNRMGIGNVRWEDPKDNSVRRHGDDELYYEKGFLKSPTYMR
jgi:hypothetical protein